LEYYQAVWGEILPPENLDITCVLEDIKGSKKIRDIVGEKNPMWGKRHSSETRMKISIGVKNKWKDPIYQMKRSLARKRQINPMQGKHHSLEAKIKIGLASKNREGSNLGKHLSPETRKKISLALKGEKNPWWGRHHSKETRLKMQKIATGRCCSEETYKKLRENHADVRGEKNPRWKGGLSFEPYTTGWTKLLKESIRLRDCYTCQLCGELQNGEKFHIHHIDYDKKNCDPRNLITLCCKCHSKTNSNRDYWINFLKKKVKILNG